MFFYKISEGNCDNQCVDTKGKRHGLDEGRLETLPSPHCPLSAPDNQASESGSAEIVPQAEVAPLRLPATGLACEVQTIHAELTYLLTVFSRCLRPLEGKCCAVPSPQAQTQQVSGAMTQTSPLPAW